MKLHLVSFCFLCLLSSWVNANSVLADSDEDVVTDFTGYRVLRFHVKSLEETKSLLELEEEEGIQLWSDPKFVPGDETSTEPNTEAVDVMVAPEGEKRLNNFLEEMGEKKMKYRVLIPDIQAEIDQQENELKETFQDGSDLETAMNWDKYHDIHTIHEYMDYVVSKNSGIAKVETYGTSSEGRALKAVKIQSGKAKKTIFIEAGIHAREWITPATATYFLNELLLKKDNAQLVEDFNWIIVPSVNPDGYQHSRKSNRLWRKTRAGSKLAKAYALTGTTPVEVEADVVKTAKKSRTYRQSFGCIGVDANRNWGFHWKEGGSSTNPCSETYAGPSAFSEPETKSLSEYVLENNKDGKMIAYFAVHSYSQMWLLPWGFTTNATEDAADLRRLAGIGVKALEGVHGIRFRIGAVPDLLYIASGSSHDWAKGAAGVKYSYTLELRDRGFHGFILPPKYIQPTVEETWAAVKACAENLR